MKIKSWAIKNFIPMVLELFFVFFAINGIIENIYLNFVFQAIIIFYFYKSGEISLKAWMESLKDYKKIFYVIVFIVIGGIVIILIEKILPNLPKGEFLLRTKNKIQLFFFLIQTIILAPIGNEVFYRKSLIPLDDNKKMPIWIFISSCFYSLEHAYLPFGFTLFFILGMFFSYIYIKVKNVYIMITAHIVVNLFVNGGTILIYILK